MLEMFEVGDGPEVPSWKTNPRRHAIRLHCLKAGGWRWRCCCGEGRTQDDLDVALLVEARTHFDQAWATAAVPIGHAIRLVMIASPDLLHPASLTLSNSFANSGGKRPT